MTNFGIFFFGISLVITGCVCQNFDSTLMQYAKGPDVVQAVVDKIRSSCIYADDRLFLRRLAYVESKDGLDPKTFRPGYHGGIWQVDQKNFESTLNCKSRVDLNGLCSRIESAFNIKWENTTWEDLGKPLYSGLAASLYLRLMAGNNTPGEIDKQASFWKQYYNSGSMKEQDFVTTLNKIDDSGCSDTKPIDIVFVVDSSASIGLINFIQMKNFLANITDSLNIGKETVHVGMVSFEYYSQVEFYLNEHYSKSDVKTAIQNVQYLYGATNIAGGIITAYQKVFTEASGGRKDAVKVIILVTDGQSNTFTTQLAAEYARAEGIVIFAIGIGAVDVNELHAAANEPDCTHTFVLSDFSEIGSLVYEIQKSACRSQQIIDLKPSNSTDSQSQLVTTNHTLTLNKTENTVVIYPDALNNGTNSSTVGIVTKVHCGIVNIYASYHTPHPGPAIHDIQSTASDGHPSVLYLNASRNGKPLYVTYVGTKLPDTSGNLHKCNDSFYSVTFTDGEHKGVDVICRDSLGERECTKTDFLLNQQYSQWFCKTESKPDTVDNPCTSEAIKNNSLYHPYPLDDSKFIRCDLQGKMYITLCPVGERYHQATHSCGTETETIDVDKVPLDPDLPNPCTKDAILANNLFFTYTRDNKKFIHCDVWGHAWILNCPTGQIWTQIAHTCTPDQLNQGSGTGTGSTDNPCTPEALQNGQFFFPLPDPNKFIHCDISGNAFVQSCIPNNYFDPVSHVCVPYHSSIVG